MVTSTLYCYVENVQISSQKHYDESNRRDTSCAIKPLSTSSPPCYPPLKMSYFQGHQYPVFSRWLGPENRAFLEVDSLVVSWWIVAFCPVKQFVFKTLKSKATKICQHYQYKCMTSLVHKMGQIKRKLISCLLHYLHYNLYMMCWAGGWVYSCNKTMAVSQHSNHHLQMET